MNRQIVNRFTPYQSFMASYMHTGTTLALDATANRLPSRDHLTSVAARSILRITSVGFHVSDSFSNVQTNAFRSCEQDTILLVRGDQSMLLTRRSCCHHVK